MRIKSKAGQWYHFSESAIACVAEVAVNSTDGSMVEQSSSVASTSRGAQVLFYLSSGCYVLGFGITQRFAYRQIPLQLISMCFLLHNDLMLHSASSASNVSCECPFLWNQQFVFCLSPPPPLPPSRFFIYAVAYVVWSLEGCKRYEMWMLQ